MKKYDLDFKFGMNNSNRVRYSHYTQCFWFENDDGEKYTFLLEELKEFLDNVEIKPILQ